MKIRAFRGYRYGIDRVKDVTAVVAPPYDQITPDMQDRLLAMSADNIVRITLPQANRYDGAREVLDRWLADGVWGREDGPAIYPYEQTYAVGGVTITRVGFIALGAVTDYADKIVLPHERTHSGPKQDRMRLLEATGADVGLLFMLVPDPDGTLRAMTAPTGPPIAEARDLKGEHHRLWRIADPGVIGHDGDVGVHAHLGGSRDAVAVDRRDDRLGVVPDREVAVDVALQPVSVPYRVGRLGHAHLAQVVPRGETAALAPDGQDRRSGRLQRLERIAELVEELIGQRVRAVRTVQHDPGEVLLVLDTDVAVIRVVQVHVTLLRVAVSASAGLPQPGP